MDKEDIFICNNFSDRKISSGYSVAKWVISCSKNVRTFSMGMNCFYNVPEIMFFARCFVIDGQQDLLYFQHINNSSTNK